MNQLEVPHTSHEEGLRHPAELETEGCSRFRLSLEQMQRNDPRYMRLGRDGFDELSIQ